MYFRKSLWISSYQDELFRKHYNAKLCLVRKRGETEHLRVDIRWPFGLLMIHCLLIFRYLLIALVFFPKILIQYQYKKVTNNTAAALGLGNKYNIVGLGFMLVHFGLEIPWLRSSESSFFWTFLNSNWVHWWTDPWRLKMCLVIQRDNAGWI